MLGPLSCRAKQIKNITYLSIIYFSEKGFLSVYLVYLVFLVFTRAKISLR